MNSYKKLNLLELMDYAKNITFNNEGLDHQNISSWNQDVLFNSAINIVVNNEILKASAIRICDMFTPLKILFKTTIRSYIKTYGERF